jgi:hypothetical protein
MAHRVFVVFSEEALRGRDAARLIGLFAREDTLYKSVNPLSVASEDKYI